MKDIRHESVAVGDRVVCPFCQMMRYDCWICDRKNYMIRHSSNLSKYSQILANLDLVALVVTVNYPETFTIFIDRFLATTEAIRFRLSDKVIK